MNLQDDAASALHRVRRRPRGLRRLAKLERILAALLVLTPLLLILVDTGPDGVRDSISAYNDVGTPQAFYVPLTVGAMLFLVNGVVKRAHVYNTLLGVALSGVIVFDHDGGRRYCISPPRLRSSAETSSS